MSHGTRWRSVAVLPIALMVGCGATGKSMAPTSRAPAATSVTESSTLPAVATPSPTDAATPLLYLVTANGPDLLVNADGIETGTLPHSAAAPYVRSQFGARLFGVLNYGIGTGGDARLVAINPDASLSVLSPPIPKTQFVDAIGAENGMTWALVTVADSCTSTHRATLEQGTETATRVLASLPAVDAQWTLMSYNQAGIVVQAQACTFASPVVATVIVDPVRGEVTDLTPRLGSGCDFVSISDSDTLVCVRIGHQPSLVVTKPDGSRQVFSFAAGKSFCRGREVGFGLSQSAGLSADGQYLAASYSCLAPGVDGGRDQLLLISTVTGHVAEAPASLYLDGVRWLPGDRLVASRPTGIGSWPQGTWLLSTDGTATVISTVASASG